MKAFARLPFPDSALFSFAETCGVAVVNGVYKIATPLNASDSVNISVNVIQPGPFSIQTLTVTGMKFSAAGTFSHTGKYIVTLKGIGIPTTSGNITIPITIAGINCSLMVLVEDTVINSDLYWQFTSEGISLKGILDSALVSIGYNNLYPANAIYQLQDYGRPYVPPSAQITFNLNIARINQSLSIGSYSPAFQGSRDFTGSMQHTDTTGNLSSSNDMPSFAIVVTTFDTVTRLVEGIFFGPVIDQVGQTHTITDGAFRTYFKK